MCAICSPVIPQAWSLDNIAAYTIHHHFSYPPSECVRVCVYVSVVQSRKQHFNRNQHIVHAIVLPRNAQRSNASVHESQNEINTTKSNWRSFSVSLFRQIYNLRLLHPKSALFQFTTLFEQSSEFVEILYHIYVAFYRPYYADMKSTTKTKIRIAINFEIINE